jgi:hypothetical protein
MYGKSVRKTQRCVQHLKQGQRLHELQPGRGVIVKKP